MKLTKLPIHSAAKIVGALAKLMLSSTPVGAQLGTCCLDEVFTSAAQSGDKGLAIALSLEIAR